MIWNRGDPVIGRSVTRKESMKQFVVNRAPRMSRRLSSTMSPMRMKERATIVMENFPVIRPEGWSALWTRAAKTESPRAIVISQEEGGRFEAAQ